MDISFDDYASWRAEAEKLRLYTLRMPSDDARLDQLDQLILVWLEIAKRLTGCHPNSDTAFWKHVKKIDLAGINAEWVGDAPSVHKIFSEQNKGPEPGPIPREPEVSITARILKDLRWGLKTFMVVENIDREWIPFDLLDTGNSRSVYQELAYGPVIDDLQAERHPEGSPICGAWTKPRQVGSTTFWEKLLALLGSVKRLRILIHFPQEDDANEHLQKMLRDIRRLSSKWPEYFPPIRRQSITRGTIELENGTIFAIRHGGGSGVKKVGQNWDFVILSEAGKYERNAPGAWARINTAIIPAVHAGPWRAVIHEGTNDEVAYELQRISQLARLEHSPYRFFFYNWTIIQDYVGPAIRTPHTGPSDSYHDFAMKEGDRVAVSEAEYCNSHRLTPRQIGFRRNMIDKLGSLELFHQEYPLTYEESCVAVSTKFFGQEILSHRYPPPRRIFTFFGNAHDGEKATRVRDIQYAVRESIDGRWWIWEEPNPTKHYVLGGDFSDGIPGGDFTALPVFCVETGKQVAGCMFRGGKRNEIEIAKEMAYITAFYGHRRVTVIAEMNNVGKAVRSRWIDHRHVNNWTRTLGRTSYDEDSDAMWFATGTANRTAALLALRTGIASGECEIMDQRFGIQTQDFIKHETGKYAHAEQVSALTGERAKDDYIVACALAWVAVRDSRVWKKAHTPTPETPASTQVNRAASSGSFDQTMTYSDMLGSLIG